MKRGMGEGVTRALFVSSVDRKLPNISEIAAGTSLAAVRVFDEFLGLNALYATASTTGAARERRGEGGYKKRI